MAVLAISMLFLLAAAGVSGELHHAFSHSVVLAVALCLTVVPEKRTYAGLTRPPVPDD